MDNEIKITEREIDGVNYQFKYTSNNKQIEVSERKHLKKWYGKVKYYWEIIHIGNGNLYREITKFHLYNLHSDMKIEMAGNESLNKLILEIDGK